MKHDEHMWQISPNQDEAGGSLEQAQVPPTLLPTVLQRLGLASEQPQDELTLADLAIQLTSEQWEVRAVAVRALGKRHYSKEALALLITTLDDTDATVRAAAVSALGNRERQVPLQHLFSALHDTSWQVREQAVFALANQGPLVPREVLTTALHDSDGSVREVARLVLQQRATANPATSFAKRGEQNMMQQENQDSLHSNNQEYAISYDTEPHDMLPGTAYSRHATQAYAAQEQAQVYAPSGQEYERPFYEGETPSSRWEKATSYPPRQAPKFRWGIVVLTALIFFILGALAAGSFTSVVPFTKSMAVRSEAQPIKAPMAPNDPLNSPQFASIATNDIASGLHLTTSQILDQLKTGKSMTDIAAGQNVSIDQLRSIEQKALEDMLNQEVKAGIISQDAVGGIAKIYQYDPQALDKTAANLFFVEANSPNTINTTP